LEGRAHSSRRCCAAQGFGPDVAEGTEQMPTFGVHFPIADHAFKESSDDMLERYERAKTEAKKQIASAP
jgi:hypothetical protein